MAQYQITVDQELLHRLFLGNNKDAGVSALLESVLNQILQAQATEQGSSVYPGGGCTGARADPQRSSNGGAGFSSL